MAMEVSLLSKTGIPQDTYLSMRAGTARRQAAITCSKPFYFPKLGVEESPIKCDIMQSIGTAYLVLKPGEERYQATFIGNGPEGMACEFEVRPAQKDANSYKDTSVKEKTISNDEAQKYLDSHGLLPFVQAVLQTVIKERPADPFQHVARHFSCGYDPLDGRSPVNQRLIGSDESWKVSTMPRIKEGAATRVSTTSTVSPVTTAPGLGQAAALPPREPDRRLSVPASSASSARSGRSSRGAGSIRKAVPPAPEPALDQTLKLDNSPRPESVVTEKEPGGPAAAEGRPGQESGDRMVEPIASPAAEVHAENAPAPAVSKSNSEAGSAPVGTPFAAAMKVQLNNHTVKMTEMAAAWATPPASEEGGSCFTRVTGVSCDEEKSSAAQRIVDKALAVEPQPQQSRKTSVAGGSNFSRVSGASIDEEVNCSAAQRMLDQALLSAAPKPRSRAGSWAGSGCSRVSGYSRSEAATFTRVSGLSNEEAEDVAARTLLDQALFHSAHVWGGSTCSAQPPAAQEERAATSCAEAKAVQQGAVSATLETAEGKVAGEMLQEAEDVHAILVEAMMPAAEELPPQEEEPKEEEAAREKASETHVQADTDSEDGRDVEEDDEVCIGGARGQVLTRTTTDLLVRSLESGAEEWHAVEDVKPVDGRHVKEDDMVRAGESPGQVLRRTTTDLLVKRDDGSEQWFAVEDVRPTAKKAPADQPAEASHEAPAEAEALAAEEPAPQEGEVPKEEEADGEEAVEALVEVLVAEAEEDNAAEKESDAAEEHRAEEEGVQMEEDNSWEGLIARGLVQPTLDWHAAAAAGEVRTMEWLTSTREDANGLLESRDGDKSTALHHAARTGKLDVCEWLLKREADPNVQDRGRATPLHLACLGGHLDVVDLLLSPGRLWADSEDGCPISRWPDASSADLWKCTALHRAAEGGNAEVVTLLLNNKADMSKEDREGDTALHKAVAAGHADVVEAMLRKPRLDPPIDSTNASGLSPLDLCVFHKQVAAGDLLQRAGAKLVKDVRKKPPMLLEAVQKGLPFMVTYVLRSAPTVGPTSRSKQLANCDSEGRTSLSLAAQAGSEDILHRLLEGKADPTVAAPNGRLPIHEAAAAGQAGALKTLFSHGVAESSTDDSGRTVLFDAAEAGQAQLCTWLLDRGFDINARDNSESSVLHVAAAGGHVGVCEVLLGRATALGCFEELLHAENWEGSTAVHAAVKCGSEAVCRCLAFCGLDLHAPLDFGATTLQVAAELGHGDVLELLISDLVDKEGIIDAVDARRVSDSRSAWLVAVAAGHEPCAAMLWEAAGSEELGRSTDRTGRDALMLAAGAGHVAMCQWLLATPGACAGISARDSCGGTPLHIASCEGHADVVELLLAAGADLLAEDEDGKTAKDWAAARQHHRVEALLRDAVQAASA